MVEEYPDIDELEDISEDQLEDQMEQQADVQEEIYGDSTPSYKAKEDLFSLFWKVVRTQNSSKVGNLDPKTELGMLDISVRDGQRINLIGETLGHPDFGRFFDRQSEIILSTSASKKGWLPELFVSQRKFATKTREKKLPEQEGVQQQKKGFFRR